jgi:hypothetical protein
VKVEFVIDRGGSRGGHGLLDIEQEGCDSFLAVDIERKGRNTSLKVLRYF